LDRDNIFFKPMLEQIEQIKKKLDGMASVHIPMSQASLDVASSILDGLQIKRVVLEVDSGTGPGESQMEQYQWGKEEEKQGYQGCKQILEAEMLPLCIGDDQNALGIYDVRNYSLPEVKAGNYKSTGKSDLAVGPKESMDYALVHAKCLVLSYTVALIELKTDKAELKPGQLLLQLVSLAMISGRGQGVVVLGTDCVNTWQLMHFTEHNTIVQQAYMHGKKCIANFKTLILESSARKAKNVPPLKLASGHEDDFNLEGFGVEETDRDKAIAREDELGWLAHALGSLYGETLEVPHGAKASETCPSYYM
jgi:hypothetical protein